MGNGEWGMGKARCEAGVCFIRRSAFDFPIVLIGFSAAPAKRRRLNCWRHGSVLALG